MVKIGDSNSFSYGHNIVIKKTGECMQTLSKYFLRAKANGVSVNFQTQRL